MSSWLLVFVPVALFFIVSSLCFVGCFLDVSGLPGPTKYSDDDVLSNLSIAAYWPLFEPSNTPDLNPATAHDTAGAKVGDPHDGTYVHKGNAPAGTFPCPAFQVAPGIDSAAELGGVALGTASIVSGDAKQPGNDPKFLTTGMTVTGGFVRVPFTKVVNPDVFTVEAWVRPEWDPAVVATRAIVDSRGFDTAVTGFVLWVNNDGNWEAVLNGTNGGFAKATAGKAALGTATYVAMTFDGTNVSLFTEGTRTAGPTPLSAGSFKPNATHDLIIGAGMPWLPPRPMGGGGAFFPLLPFNGTIQDVAIYNTVLDDAVIETHANHGHGRGDPAG